MVVAVMLAIPRITCAIYSNETNRETRYSMFLGCTVKMGNAWVPRNEIRVTE